MSVINQLKYEHLMQESFYDKLGKVAKIVGLTIEWLTWYNSLTEEEQLAVSHVPADLLELEGLANGSDMEAETKDAD